ncbi:hypothetical protein [Rhizobium sp. BK176]|uniref:hypothetical protein n=1 Tax=Rhizobium sp. BK176 TaxID=2587071 RepID=UPI00216780B9|nr:hypothetical protein [Rhizobium sp. BK176]MCS4089873.1 hypothetical protein [Rhizobium sp. BK176]
MTIMDYGDRSILGIVQRLRDSDEDVRVLDALVWLHLGCDYPMVRWQASPIDPNHPVNGFTMARAMDLGYHGVHSAFSVPALTADIGAAYRIFSLWFPEATLDLSTGGGAILHRATLTDGSAGTHVGESVISGAAALCAALLMASACVARPAFPPARIEG